jgi:uncharacterized membrane protein
VRILLIAQSVALALGALPVFWIAREQLSIVNGQRTTHHAPFSTLHSPLSSWAALAFAAAYLLFPHLQAANIADFHADPFVVAPLLFAFWYASQKRWRLMWFWAIIAMATKETLPTLTAMLGLWLLVESSKNSGELKGTQLPLNSFKFLRVPFFKVEATHGLGLILTSALWFLIATFFIVTPLARQYFGTEGPIYLANRYLDTNLLSLWQDTTRWWYLLGLLAAVGFLPLLAPELLILGLPVLIANLLSNFPGQYSGEQHYSAPLVAAFILGAIYGSRRLISRISLYEKNGQSFKMTALICVSLWLLFWTFGYHALHGWTPLSSRMEIYAMRPPAANLSQFISQIPAEAIVSASAAIHPHLAHRRVIYLFPTVQEAEYLLVDVTDIPGVHPNDAQAKIMDMLTSNWQLLRANHGLILAQKSTMPLSSPVSIPPCPGAKPPVGAAPPLPCSFFDFARPTTSPTYATQLTFGNGRLRLLGYDVQDDRDNGVTFRFYWQSSGKLPEDLRLWPLVYDDWGRLLNDPIQVPMIATIWYPPAAWQPNEIVVTETLPQLLPNTFHVGLAAGPEDSFAEPTRRFSVTTEPDEAIRLQAGQWVQLASFRRQGPFLTHLTATPKLQALTPAAANFGSAIKLTGFRFDSTKLHPGATLPILLQWVAEQPPQTDLTVFIHLLAADGQRVAQNDAYPTWLTPQPTSQWLPHQPVLDSHLLNLPPDLPPGVYTLQLGLYNVQTLERLRLPDNSDTFTLGQVRIP